MDYCKELNNNGYLSFYVGGYVRDLLIKKIHNIDIISNDKDIVSFAPTRDIKKLFGIKLMRLNKKYRTYRYNNIDFNLLKNKNK